MLDPLIDLLNSRTPLYPPYGRIVVIAVLFVLAWLLARATAAAARAVLAWHDGRYGDETALAGRLARHKRRETIVSIVRTGIAYAGFAAALVLSVAQLVGGVDRIATIAGASFLLLIAAFSAQRVLVDVIAGFVMFCERWYSVGDTIRIAALDLQGVVEDVSLRRTKLRSLNGELVQVHNSQIPAVSVLPHSVKEISIELFVSDLEAGRALVLEGAALVPTGPTTFLGVPELVEGDDFGAGLARLRLRASVAPGREWLAESFFADLLKERARPGLIVHGPVALDVDERAARSFARARATTGGELRALASLRARRG